MRKYILKVFNQSREIIVDWFRLSRMPLCNVESHYRGFARMYFDGILIINIRWIKSLILRRVNERKWNIVETFNLNATSLRCIPCWYVYLTLYSVNFRTHILFWPNFNIPIHHINWVSSFLSQLRPIQESQMSQKNWWHFHTLVIAQ